MALITVAEAANMCGVTTQTILNWGERGIITIKKHKGKDGRKWWHVNKGQIDEICSVSQDIQQTKKFLEEELENLRNDAKKVIEARKQTLLDLGIINPMYMDKSKQLLKSIINMACACGDLKGREVVVLERFIDGDTFENIGEDLEISRERVRQIFGHACRKIKAAKAIVQKVNDYENTKSMYNTVIAAGKSLQKENEVLREKLGIRKEEERLKTLQERKAYLNETDEICKLLSKNLYDCDLSVRALNCLKCADIKTVGDLVQYAKSDLLKFRNFGKKSLTELDDFIEDNGLHWSMDIESLYIERARLYFTDNEDEES